MQVESLTERKLTCEWLRYDVVNYAMQQNFVPVVRKLSVSNISSEDLREVTVNITAEPAFAGGFTKTLDLILAGQSVEIGVVDLPLSGKFLAELTERMTGELRLEVRQGKTVLYEQSAPLTVLAYDQWGGLASMPEMIAAFVMPNHPVVAKVIGEAAPLLEKWTGNPSFDAYQSQNPNRVRMQAAAIYSALQAHQPTYCVSPASFEEVGQRVRLPDAVLMNRMGNCLDLTLLYVACLEAIGLHPLVIFKRGHAFSGVWLVEETFMECVQDDLTLLTKRLATGVHELSISEATLMCAGQHAPYQESERHAIAQLEDAESFLGFVDIKRARASAIRPIPIRISTPDGWEIVRDRTEHEAVDEAPEDMMIHTRPMEVSSIAVTKQKQWERKLLDLTLRNTLLNFRLTKGALPLLHAQLGELEDAMAAGGELQLLPKPADWADTARSTDLFQSLSKDQPMTQLVRQEFLHKRLRADAGEKELAEKAIYLYRSARLSLEENGANTLYLALGLLKWFESTASELPRYAPIVLVPVELVRKSSSAGFVLRMRDEETQLNITLLEMLRQDFGLQIGGLDPLPRDENGIDLAGIFTTIRHVIMNRPRWDIVESAYIGLFSFSRFVMWNDIRSRADDLAKNKVVASLMAGRLTWEPGESFPEIEGLDERYAPDQLLLPISADSSQIAAVSAANSDKSFVLHGPPGTGKSQTITNMIASALASGKTVLFVAEKMAALSVVQSRLEQIGLGPFCLELHSNKSTKKAVLEQLRKTLETSRTAPPEEWKRQADRLAAARSELNRYVSSLHKKYGFGASLYEAITRYESVKEAPAAVSFDPAVVSGMTPESFHTWSDLTREMRVAGEACGHPHANVWEDSARTDYTPALKPQVENVLAAYSSKLSEVQAAYADVINWMGYQPALHSREELEKVCEIGELLQAMPESVPPQLLSAADLATAREQVGRAVQHGQSRNDLRQRITARFTAEALAFDAGFALAEWRKAELQWFLPKWLKQNRIGKILKGMAAQGAALQKGQTVESLTWMIRYQEEAGTLKQLEPAVSPALGSLWESGEADWAAVERASGWIEQLHQRLTRLYADAAQVHQARERISRLLASGRELFWERYMKTTAHLLQAKKEADQLEAQLSHVLDADFRSMDQKRGAQPWFAFRQQKIRQWSESMDRFREWSIWRKVRGRAEQAGLASLVSAYEQGELRHEEVEPSFERAWWRAAIEYVLSVDTQLASFSGRLFEEKIRGFQESTELFEKWTRQEIFARLAARIPSLQSQAASSSEAGLLLRAIKSGGRGLSLRKLFEQIPNLLNRICPCLLMSPMSVAQYLDPRYAPFDLVVFDEASQLPTSEAVGAMARGHSVVIVGDPKQLPPTSFFSAMSSGEPDDASAPEDLESILDDCLALGMPQEHLLWHYRSRHESLIAFSNRHFYENKLLTFPSPLERKSNVQWHPVKGYYDRGRTKQNRAEAEAVVAEIACRLRDPELCRRSIGVVTFNSIQQSLIEDLLEVAFRKEAELEAIAAQLPEPIFVKNLENVQGDERDVILFSIGYGPDSSGKVSLNFGPLNREGGWRRLNVAVSRARHEMHVFSTLRADHLDVSRTRSQGVSALRSFLEYAEKGASALRVQADQLESEQEGLEKLIAKAMAKEGYQVDTQIGASGYRIDLGVVDSAHPDKYLLAILCDGNGYKTGKTARDREVLREQVLRQLGWRIHRVWSLDWLDNPSREMQRIREAIEAARAKQKEPVNGSREKLPAGGEAGRNETKEAVETGSGSFEQAVSTVMDAAVQELLPSSCKTVYQPCVLPLVALPSEDFYNPANKRVIREQVTKVIKEEGPISRTLVSRRVLQAWGLARSGARIERHFDTVFGAMKLKKTTWDGAVYFWPEQIDPVRYGKFRVAEREQDRRNAEDLPPEEIAAAVKEILFNQISLPQEDLIKETVKLLGYARTGAALEKAVKNGLSEVVRRGDAAVEQGRVYCKE